MTRLDWSRVKGRRSVLVIVLDDDVTPQVMAGGDRAGDDHVSVVTAPMMALAMVVEGDLPLVPVMKASAFVADDHGFVMVMAMGPNDHVCLGRGSHHRGRHQKRHSANEHCFHCEYSICLEIPSIVKPPPIALVPADARSQSRAGGFHPQRQRGRTPLRCFGQN